MTSGSGTREVTEKVRATAIKRELVQSSSRLHITPGMRRALAELRSTRTAKLRAKPAS